MNMDTLFKLELGKALQQLNDGFNGDQGPEAIANFMLGVSTVMELMKEKGLREPKYLACVLRKCASGLNRCADIIDSLKTSKEATTLDEINIVDFQVAEDTSLQEATQNYSADLVPKTPLCKQAVTTSSAEILPVIVSGSVEGANVRNDGDRLTYDFEFKDIIGLHNIKKVFWQTFTLPSIVPLMFTLMPSWKSILLFGPPGTGKTSIVCAAAKESNWNYFTIMPAEMFERYVGDSEKMVKQTLQRALRLEPCIIIIDEVDAMVPQRNENTAAHELKFQSQLLQAISDAAENHRIIFIGITNKPELLDAAMLRRFEAKLAVPLPTRMDRMLLFKKFVSPFNNNLEDRDYVLLAERSARFSGDDIKLVVKSAYLDVVSDFYYDVIKKKLDPTDVCQGEQCVLLAKKKIFCALQHRKASASTNDIVLFNSLKSKFDNGYG